MRVKTRAQEEVLEQLDRLAGNPSLVDEALRELTNQLRRPPSLREVMGYVLQKRVEREGTPVHV
jgi:hypothetical protein